MTVPMRTCLAACGQKMPATTMATNGGSIGIRGNPQAVWGLVHPPPGAGAGRLLAERGGGGNFWLSGAERRGQNHGDSSCPGLYARGQRAWPDAGAAVRRGAHATAGGFSGRKCCVIPPSGGEAGAIL